MCAAGPRPAIPALARMLENNADHACQTGAPTGLACLPLPQALLSFSIINGNGYHSQDQPHRQYPSNRHRTPLQLAAPPSATSCIAGLPTPADAACGSGPPRPASANLVWGDFCQGGGCAKGPIHFSSLRVSLFDLPFLRPDPQSRRAGAHRSSQGWRASRHPQGPWSLTGSSTTARLLRSG